MALPDAFDDLLDQRVWVAWDDEDGRKVPKSPSGGNARSNDSSTWGTYTEAEAAASRNGYSGVGVMFTDGLIGIDLDGAVSGGEVAGWAQEIVDSLGSYAELSPSGTGLHILAWADPNVVGAIGSADHAAGIEVYNNRRYFTVTGNALNDAMLVDITQDVPGFLERWLAGKSSEEHVRRSVGSLSADQVKRLANKTMTDNCARDGVRYARVPTGRETCGFCLMLASRGFVYHTSKTAGEMNHYHRSCDCKVVVGFDGLTEVEGYDPDALLDIYYEARSRLGGSPSPSRISREIEKVLAEREAQTAPSASNISFSNEQIGKKIAKHAGDWGLDPSNASDRQAFIDITQGIINYADQITTGEWRDQPNPCIFYRKGDDVVIVNAYGEYVTTMKGGASNARYKRTLENLRD